MRVRVLVKHRENNRGNIVEILPINEPLGRLVLRSHYPVDIDIEVPCGAGFQPPYKCAKCVDNHPDTCDVRLYKTAIWSAGGVLDPPRLINKRRYRINLETVIPKEIETIAYKLEKTENEKQTIKNRADSICYQKNIIEDKTEVKK